MAQSTSHSRFIERISPNRWRRECRWERCRLTPAAGEPVDALAKDNSETHGTHVIEPMQCKSVAVAADGQQMDLRVGESGPGRQK
jgi:hypothetical protein